MNYTYKNILLGLVIVSCFLDSSAQAPSDAYQSVQEGIIGTARTKSLGGASGAIGVDPGAVYINPAGLGLLSRSTFGIGFDAGKGSSSVATKDVNITRTLGLSDLNNISYFSRGFMIPTTSSNYLRINYGFSFGQEYNYKRDYEMQNAHPASSIATLLASKANQILDFTDQVNNTLTTIGEESRKYKRTETYDPFESNVDPFVALGLNSLVVNFRNNDEQKGDESTDWQYETSFFSGDNRIPLELNGNILNVSERGKKNYTDFNIAFNLNDRYYFGGALRLGTMNYSRASMLREDFIDPKEWKVDQTSYLEYGSTLDITGASVSLNLGFLMALGDYGRIGITYLTPQYSQYKKLYSASIRNFNNNIVDEHNKSSTISFETGEYRIDYGVVTPGKLTLSAMAFLSKYGMISYDFQYRNLGHSKVLINNDRFRGVSNYIKDNYGAELTHRVGLEVRPINWVVLRAGYAYTGNPLKTDPLKKEAAGGLNYEYPANGMVADFVLPRSYQAITGGVGFSLGRSTTIDLAYVHEIRKEKAYPFTGWTGPDRLKAKPIAVRGGNLKETRGSFVANLTFRF